MRDTVSVAEFPSHVPEIPRPLRQTPAPKREPQAAPQWDSSCITPYRRDDVLGERTLERIVGAGCKGERCFVSGYTIGSFIHVLLVIALVLVLVQFVSGRRVV
jgi:hypothetical protein